MKKPTPASEVSRLRTDISALLRTAADSSLTNPARTALNEEVRIAIAELDGFLRELDPIRQPSSMFDPSNPKIIGRFVALAMVAQQRHPLSEVPTVYGAGVYAIYYRGSFPLYAPWSGTEHPLYVGQAAPADRNARTPTEQGPRLSARLKTHRKNVGKATTTLDVNDFEYRSLVVQSGWETAAEDYLIQLFRPLWNSETSILYGLGKHGDDADTRGNKRSPWDTLHPGRKFAERTKEDAKSISRTEQEVAEHGEIFSIYRSLDSVLASFLNELRQ